jgi:hypothetical protein
VVPAVQVKVSNYPFNNLIYSAADRSCSNVVVGYDLQILTGVAFSANNLQNKVSYATALGMSTHVQGCLLYETLYGTPCCLRRSCTPTCASEQQPGDSQLQ